MKHNKPRSNYEGAIFHRLTVLSGYERHGDVFWVECRCECGNICYSSPRRLVSGEKKSCGCLQKEHASRLGTSKKGNYDVTSKEYKMWLRARARANLRECSFDLAPEDIVIPEYCPITGLKLDWNSTKLKENSPSLDRIDLRKGYVKGNIAVISNRANRLKSDASLIELKSIVKYIEDNKNEG